MGYISKLSQHPLSIYHVLIHAFLEENFIKHIVNKKKRPVIFRCDVNYRRSLINDELLNVDKPSPTEELEPDFEALLRGKEKSS